MAGLHTRQDSTLGERVQRLLVPLVALTSNKRCLEVSTKRACLLDYLFVYYRVIVSGKWNVPVETTFLFFSGIRTPAKKPNVKLGDHSSNLISSEETFPNARLLHCAAVSCFEASATVKERHLLSKPPAKLPASNRKASPDLLSTHQLFHDSFWPEVFKNSTKNLVLDVSMTRVITGCAAPNSMSSSSTVAGSRKRKRDGEYDTLSSNKRLR